MKAGLSCTAEDARGLVLTTAPTWSSTDPNVAIVSATGNVVGQRAGSAIVSCTVDGRTASATVTVAESPIAFLEVTPGAGTLEVGKTIQLEGTPRTATGGVVTGRQVQWSTTDSVTATVSSTGAVVGLVEGTATVIATSAGKASLARINVSGKPVEPVASLVLKVDATSLSVGKQTRATASTKDASGGTLNNRSITWSVGDPSIISVVSINGEKATITALGKGTTQVTATSEGRSASETITVTAAPAVVAPTVQTVTVSLASPSILPLGTSQATATVKDANGIVLTDRVVTWSTLDGSIAVVSQTGLVTAVATGAVIVRATVEGKTGDASLTVGVASAASVTVNLAATSILPGQTTQATAIPKDASGNILTGKYIAWSTLNPSIATVSISGVVTSVAPGSATIRATVESQTGEKSLTVAAAPVAPAPVATVTASLATYALTVGQTTQASAVALDAGGAVLTGRTVSWSSVNPAVATVSTSGLVTAVAAGSVAIRATIETKNGDTPALTVSAPVTVPTSPAPLVPGDAEFPRVFLSTSVASTPSAGRTLRVAAGGDLQATLDGAVPGDRILLAAGATFSGNFILREKSGGISGGWITVQSDGTLPAENSRVSPSQAANLAFPKIISPNILPVIATNGAAARWRFIAVEVTTDPNLTTNQGLVALGCPNACETTLASQPYDIIFDRTYVHGTPTLDVRRCFGFNGARLAVIESYVSECHSGFDAQAIAGWNGPGPFKITNNYLQGAAENIAFGGGDPVVYGANLVPSDIEIRGNHITKPLTWNGKWLTKNLIELKQGRRVLIQGNVMENSWPSGQAGYAFVLWSVNQQATCPWCVTEQVTVQDNIIRNVAGGFNLAATGSNGLAAYTAVPMNHLTIRNNVIIGLDNSAVAGNGRIFQISDGTIGNLVIEHNTAFSPSNSSFLWGGSTALTNHVVRNNLVGGGQYQLFSPWGQGQIAWDHAGGPGSIFERNAVAAFSGGNMVAGANWGLASLSDVGLVGGASSATSVSATLDQLTLGATSQLKGQATDGTDVGANIPVVAAATNGVTLSGAVANMSALGRLRLGSIRP